ncbi:hypothetical protein BLA60_16930 [Actinophytocola xinjiangensis]|uniref:DUF3893 domain-containing protein n=1 Tax=Actinophytocola xinjiangensis TaxID=485602 RepID=A0A7Z1AY55_9PSEU|nr:RNaseH domain-containing protein [Actinophytocola xinjiangensis]OLF10132.1 hypothetical protein BLA60_16930 [Actinophytocola xinjiangensis]
MTTANKELALLAYPLTSVLHGSAHLHWLPDGTGRAWERMRSRFRERVHHNVNLPYSGLATALRAYSGASVNLFPTSRSLAPKLLISSRRLDPRDLHDAVVLWEQALDGVRDSDIDFGYSSDLADLVVDSVVEEVALADRIRFHGDQPDAPNWVYDAATWEAARLLSKAVWRVDGRDVRLRADTDGNLLVWERDTLWSSPWKDGVVNYAALRIRLQMKTMPGVRTPILVLDPGVSRLSWELRGARSAWLAPRHEDDPLLCLAVERGQNSIEKTSMTALSVAHRLRGERLLGQGELALSGPPDRLRALVRKSMRFPIGRGVGMYTVRELAHHAAGVLGESNVSASRVSHLFSRQAHRKVDKGRDVDLLDEGGLPSVIKASGAERLRLLVLYSTQGTRTRVQRLLAYHFSRGDLADGIPEDTLVGVHSHVEVVFHHASEFLAHGDRQTRGGMPDLVMHEAPDGTRVLALCETEYDGKKRDDDAKPDVSRMLAGHGVLAQFLVTAPQVEDPAKDHAGHSALADLFRLAGLVHPRLTEALSFKRPDVDKAITYVGLHVRAQRGEMWRSGTPKLSWALVAMIPDGNHWRTLAYQADEQSKTGLETGWHDYSTVNAAFRATRLSEGKRQDTALVEAIDTALGALRSHLAPGMGYVLMASGDSSRSLWPLLANKNLDREPDAAGRVDGRPALPGWTLEPCHRPLAVVRVTSGTRDLPRPVEVRDVAGHTTTSTTSALFRLNGSTSTWILSNIPRQWSGEKRTRRLGAQHSRWSADTQTGRHTWYAHTTTEILVIGAETDPERHAVAAARLCHHAVSWDGRTRYPAPVHLAALMDRDHPQYRRTVDWDDETDYEESERQ